jgi:hypothetical protein
MLGLRLTDFLRRRVLGDLKVFPFLLHRLGTGHSITQLGLLSRELLRVG